MKDLHEMYEELYKAIREMPLPSSPDDPEPQEEEEYVEPAWYATFGTTAEDDEADWLAPEFGSRKREWYKAFNAQLLFIRKCGGSLEVSDDLWEF